MEFSGFAITFKHPQAKVESLPSDETEESDWTDKGYPKNPSASARSEDKLCY